MSPYHAIPKAERKLLTKEVYRAHPKYRVYSAAIMIAGVCLAQWTRPLLVSTDTSRALYIAVGAVLAGSFAGILWYVIVSPLVRRSVVRRKNA